MRPPPDRTGHVAACVIIHLGPNLLLLHRARSLFTLLIRYRSGPLKFNPQSDVIEIGHYRHELNLKRGTLVGPSRT